ncbi:hypothetical protein BS47DRAFT_1367027 [Hydnum rufescens UP504]|uniref:Uncharacterized protein n=1 Tax=Hydnum rufescens UP504 TaxID=1448309 RepID=A0A9P6DQ04_9AGAM|nr:hypothetical protein BS47DRAFT_1367027 [Hydnum rufescens UP504]
MDMHSHLQPDLNTLSKPAQTPPDNLAATHPMALIPGWCAMKEELMVPHTCCGGCVAMPGPPLCDIQPEECTDKAQGKTLECTASRKKRGNLCYSPQYGIKNKEWGPPK